MTSDASGCWITPGCSPSSSGWNGARAGAARTRSNTARAVTTISATLPPAPLVRAAEVGADDGRPLAANLAPERRRRLLDEREFELLGRGLS
jgi:hypothetical protein